MQRLNVLLSRPMSLLILIGNPRTLSKNQEFRHIIDMCRDRKTLVGSPYYPDDNKTNEANGTATQSGNPMRSGCNNNRQQPTDATHEDAQTLGQTFKRSNNRCHNYQYHHQRNQRNRDSDHKCLYTNAYAGSLAFRMIP